MKVILIAAFIVALVPIARAQDDLQPWTPTERLPECTYPITQSPCQRAGRRYFKVSPGAKMRGCKYCGRNQAPPAVESPPTSTARAPAGIDWGRVARNPATWLCVGIVALCLLALRELRGVQECVNEIDRNNRRQRQILEDDIDREIERERRGDVLPPKDPELAAWWEDTKRRRRR